MYTLRVIEETRENEKATFEQVIRNIEMGGSYTRVQRGCSTVFDNTLKDYPEYAKGIVRAFLIFGNGEVYPISENDDNHNWSYFVMTDSGKTFERL